MKKAAGFSVKRAASVTLALFLLSTSISSTALAASMVPQTGISYRIHVSPGSGGHGSGLHTPTGNRVRMTPQHGASVHVGGRMSSMRSPISGGSGYVRPSIRPRHYYRPVVPLPLSRWHRSGYYSGHYWRPYGYTSFSVVYPSGYYGYPVAYYGYPVWGYGPGVRISVRL